MTEGISRELWDETPEPEDFKPVPAGTAREFEITEVRGPTYNENKDHEYVNICSTHHDDEGVAYNHWGYYALSDERRGWLKKFILEIGRGDFILAGKDADWQDLIGTTFTADVIHKKVGGDVRVNLKNVVNGSHDVTSLDAAPKAASASKAGPARPARGRTAR